MKRLLLIIAVAVQVALNAQENGFLFESEQFEQYIGTCAIETEDNCYIVCAMPNRAPLKENPSMLLKFSTDGTLLKSAPLGNSYSFVVCLYKEIESDVNYAIGCHWDPLTERIYPFIVGFDGNLNILSMRDVAGIPATYTFPVLDAAAIVNNNGKVLFVFTCQPNEIHYVIFNLEGELECFKEVLPSNTICVGSLCLLQDGSGDFGQYYSPNGQQLLRINEQLEMEPVLDFYLLQESQWNGSDTIHSIYVQSIYPTVFPLPDSSYIIAEETMENWFDYYHAQAFYRDYNTIFFKSSSDGEIENSILIDTRNDTLERPAYFQAIASSQNELYLCAFQHKLHDSFGPEINQNHIILMKTDLNLNLIWERRYTLGNACYRPQYLLSTNDGGCLITGDIKEEANSDLFVLKLNAEGTLGTPHHQIMEYPFRFFPNPVEGILSMEYSPDVTPKALELYDLQGRLLRTQSGNLEQVSMEDLPSGIYTMRVVMTDGTAYSEKVLKQ